MLWRLSDSADSCDRVGQGECWIERDVSEKWECNDASERLRGERACAPFHTTGKVMRRGERSRERSQVVGCLCELWEGVEKCRLRRMIGPHSFALAGVRTHGQQELILSRD
jgi:hypothetical protein